MGFFRLQPNLFLLGFFCFKFFGQNSESIQQELNKCFLNGWVMNKWMKAWTSISFPLWIILYDICYIIWMNFISENILNLKNILSFWPVFCFKGSFLMTFIGKETSALQRMVTRILFIILKIESNSNIEKNGEIVICVNLTWMVKYHAATIKHVCKEFLKAWKLSKKCTKH